MSYTSALPNTIASRSNRRVLLIVLLVALSGCDQQRVIKAKTPLKPTNPMVAEDVNSNSKPSTVTTPTQLPSVRDNGVSSGALK